MVIYEEAADKMWYIKDVIRARELREVTMHTEDVPFANLEPIGLGRFILSPGEIEKEKE